MKWNNNNNNVNRVLKVDFPTNVFIYEGVFNITIYQTSCKKYAFRSKTIIKCNLYSY